jgi:hypothetical protein
VRGDQALGCEAFLLVEGRPNAGVDGLEAWRDHYGSRSFMSAGAKPNQRLLDTAVRWGSAKRLSPIYPFSFAFLCFALTAYAELSYVFMLGFPDNFRGIGGRRGEAGHCSEFLNGPPPDKWRCAVNEDATAPSPINIASLP